MTAMARAVSAALAFVILTAHAASAQRASAVAPLMQDRAVLAALEHAKASEPRTIDDQIRVCEVPAPPFKEGPRALMLRRAFADAGLQNVRIDRAGNVLGDRPGRAPRPRLVVAAHLDTVFPEGTPVTVTREGNVLRGPGIGDNCRGLATLLAIVRALNTGGVRTQGTVTFVANVGEEGLGDLRGVKALFAETMKDQIDRFVSIDNAGIHVSAIGVGSHRYRVTFKGPGGHSFSQFGLPNPANALGRAIAKIAEFRVSGNPRTTFNVGRVGGGTSVNAIPDEAWMEVDMRSSDPAALAELDGRFQKAVEAAVQEENTRWGRNAVTAVKELVGNRPAGAVSENAPIMQTALAVARALRLNAVQSESSSDANLPMSLGIPAITIGAGGESFDAHALTEWFDATGAWRGTQNAVLLTVALAQD